MGEKYFNVPVRGLNINAITMTEFAKVIELPDQRKFESPRQYLLPIPANEINKNPNMVQNPNY